MIKKKPYTRPRIVAAEKIEARAIICATNPRARGKATPAACQRVRS